MKQIDKQELLIRLQQLVVNHKELCEEQIAPLTEVQITKIPSYDGWSIAHCLDHLNSYNEYYIPLIVTSLELAKENGLKTAPSSWIGRYFVSMMNPDGKKRNYNAVKKHFPAATINGKAAVAKFITFQQTLQDIISRYGSRDMTGKKIKTSISGFIKLTVADTLEFLIIHNERHLRQAERVLKDIS